MAYNFSRVKVLIVECSAPMQELLKDVLGVFTIPPKNIHACLNEEEAWRMFCAANYDLLIVDWMQSPDHGIHLTRRIRSDKTSPNNFVPIIMTAGSGHEKRVLRARDAGVSEYLVKPFSAGSLADRITRVIENPRQFVICDAYVGPDRRVGLANNYTGPERRESLSCDIDALFGENKTS